MSSLYNHALKQSKALKKDLDLFEESPGSSPLSLQGQISATLTSFTRTLDDYESAIANELSPDKKAKSQERIKNFRAELADAREKFKQLKLQREESVLQTNRSELLGRRHVPTGNGTLADASSENPYSLSTANPGYSSMSRGEGLTREHNVLSAAGHQIDEFIERGRSVLEDLTDQKEILKSTQRKVYSVAATLGISGETIRLVERRAKEDKLVFWGGVVFVLVCFYLIIRWL